MRKLITIAVAITAFLVIQLSAVADTHGTPEEAQALVAKAAALIETDGKDKAFQVIDDPNGPFVKGDLYVFVQTMEGVTLAHGTNKALIGKNMRAIKDSDGKLIVDEFIALAQSKGEGWVDYKWPNPVSKKIEPKSSFIKKVGDLIVGCGVYKG